MGAVQRCHHACIMSILHLVLLLLLLLFNAACGSSELPADSRTAALSEPQKSNLRRVISDMTGIVDPTATPPSRAPSRPALPPAPVSALNLLEGHGTRHRPPSYIYRLYERYRAGGVINGADTVRSVNAQLALVENSTLFVFNMSSFNSQLEDVVLAELHVFRARRRARRWPGWRRPGSGTSNRTPKHQSPDPDSSLLADLVLEVYELSSSALVERSSFSLATDTQQQSGWKVFDVSNVVADCVDALRDDEALTSRMIAVSFSNKNAGATTPRVRYSSVRRRFSRPSLVVYSRQRHHPGDVDDDDNDIERLHSAVLNPIRAANASDGRQRQADRSVHHASVQSKEATTRRQSTSPSSQDKFDSTTSGRSVRQGKRLTSTLKRDRLEDSTKRRPTRRYDSSNVGHHRSSRTKRDVFDNEVDVPENEEEDEPVNPAEDHHTIVTPRSSPFMLQGRRARTGRQRQTAARTPTILSNTREGDEQWFDFNIHHLRGGRRQSRRRGRRRELISDMDGLHPMKERDGRRVEGEEERKCRKKRLLVDFADIGWNDWIIAPKSFDAFYCDGTCNFPMSRRDRPTNHATIQSIVHAIGIQTDIPSPRCVPASLTSLTLLYFDDLQNVVLKNYPDMSVRACACR